MKKILGLTVAALLVMGLVGGGTWAYFSDPEASTGNVFTAGTLNMIPLTEGTSTASYSVTPGGDGINGFVTFSALEPGDTGSITWVLYNDSTVPGNLTVASTFTFDDNGDNEPELAVSDPHANDGGADGDLDEFVGVKLEYGIGADQTAAEAAFGYLVGAAGYYTAFSELEAALDAETQTLAATGGADTIVYKISFEVETDITDPGTDKNFGFGGDDGTADDNIIQSDTCTMDVTFTLTQS